MIESACPFPKQETPSPTVSQLIQNLWPRLQSFSLTDQILLNMAAALRIGLWRHNKKHRYCLILQRVQLHACITLCVQVVKRIWQSKPASVTIPKRETLLLAICQSRQILGFPSGTFSLRDWAMWTSAPKTWALKWNCSNQSAPVLQAVWGSVGVMTTLYSYCVTNTHWQHGEGEIFDIHVS